MNGSDEKIQLSAVAIVSFTFGKPVSAKTDEFSENF